MIVLLNNLIRKEQQEEAMVSPRRGYYNAAIRTTPVELEYK